MVSRMRLTGTYGGQELSFPFQFQAAQFHLVSFMVTPVELRFSGACFGESASRAGVMSPACMAA